MVPQGAKVEAPVWAPKVTLSVSKMIVMAIKRNTFQQDICFK